ERSSEKDAVRTREHVSVAEVSVTNLGLRLEDGELATNRVKIGVAEEVATAKPGAIEHQGLRKSGNVAGRCEAPHLDLPAGDLHVADHLPEVAASLHIHGVVAQDVFV